MLLNLILFYGFIVFRPLQLTPTVWNTLPDVIRASPSLASFRKQLKTYLYTKAYPP